MTEGEIRELVTLLPPQVEESLVVQRVAGNQEAFEFLVYELIQSRDLDYAGFLTQDELRRRVLDDHRYAVCPDFVETFYCGPAGSQTVFGAAPVRLDGQVIGYLLQEASRSRFTPQLDQASLVYLGLGVAGTFLLNVLAVLVVFRRKVASDLREVRRSIEAFRMQGADDEAARQIFSVTEFKEISDALHEASLLRSAAEETKRRLVKAESMMLTAQMLAHDVRRPFSLLTIGLGLLERARDPDQMRATALHLTEEVRRSTRVVNCMIEDLIEIGRSGRLELEPVDIVQLLVSTLHEMAVIHKVPDVPLTWRVDLTRKLAGNDRKLVRVFSNVIANALEATRLKTTLTLVLGERDGEAGREAQIRIRNTGSFIRAADLEKVFEMFHTEGKRQGSGLGLAIARRIVADHGGQIWCESSDSSVPASTSAGSEPFVEFVVTLPLSDTNAPSHVDLPVNLRDLRDTRHASDMWSTWSAGDEGGGSAADKADSGKRRKDE
jgi:signal transduction histidine kinase